MRRATSNSSARRGAIKASTVFAATLAIVAGLIGAFLFKKFILDRPTTALAQGLLNKDANRELTVAAGNLTICPVDPLSIKKIKVTDQQFNDIMKKYNPNGTRTLLVGDQPVRRVPVVPIKAEEPFFEDQFEPLQFPTTIGERLRPGKRAININVPADQAMIQIGDYVDVTATLMHDAFGPNGGTTACIASGRVIARFGTIYPVCCPTDPKAPTRSFTIEVTPCDYSLITLAKTLGAQFGLSVSQKPAPTEEDNVRAASTGDEEEGCCTATMKDLERIFRIPERQPKPEEKVGRLELISGSKYLTPYTYPLPEERATPTRSLAPQSAKPTPPPNPITPLSGRSK